jgi:hypothetical protein
MCGGIGIYGSCYVDVSPHSYIIVANIDKDTYYQLQLMYIDEKPMWMGYVAKITVF